MMRLSSLILAAFILAGCAGSHGTYRGDFNATVHPDGTIEVERHARSEAQTTAPKDAKESSGFSLTDVGATADSGSAWEAKAVNYAEKNTWILYVAAAVFAAGGLFCIFYLGAGFKMMGFGLCGAGAVLIFAPTFLHSVGPGLSIAIVVALVGAGVIWAVSHFKTLRHAITGPSPLTDKLGKVVGTIYPAGAK